ncbi:hypothetical protein [Streptomyces olivaceus]|uniref:hypothetical protein n=1 Tax=Streptomyces olivaceus TaxID=47716 RepID=UPI002491BCEA|nr:hypothetical protein [Streptomyces olivaceus]
MTTTDTDPAYLADFRAAHTAVLGLLRGYFRADQAPVLRSHADLLADSGTAERAVSVLGMLLRQGGAELRKKDPGARLPELFGPVGVAPADIERDIAEALRAMDAGSLSGLFGDAALEGLKLVALVHAAAIRCLRQQAAHLSRSNVRRWLETWEATVATAEQVSTSQAELLMTMDALGFFGNTPAPAADPLQEAAQVAVQLVRGYGLAEPGEVARAQLRMAASPAVATETFMLVRRSMQTMVPLATAAGVMLSPQQQDERLHAFAVLAPEATRAALIAYLEATTAGHPTGGVDIDTARGRQVSAHYAAVFLSMYGVAALGRDGFAGWVDDLMAGG